MKIKLNIADEKFATKPEKKDFRRINNDNVIGKAQREVTVEELAKELCNGKVVKYALMNSAKAEGWLQQQVFMIDIDNDAKQIQQYGYITLKEAYERAINVGVVPAFCYHTYSHMTVNENEEKHMKDKFRLVFILDGATDDLRVRNMVQECLFSIFPERDPACTDASRCFCGTCHKPLYESYDVTVSPFGLYVSAVAQIKATKNGSTGREAVKSLREKCHFDDDRIVEKFEKIKTSKTLAFATCSIIYTIEYVDNVNIFNISNSIELAKGKNKKSKSSNTSNSNNNGISIDEDSKTKTIDLAELESKCELFRRFKDGTGPLHHEGITMIASNLTQYRGATDALVKIVEDNSEYYDKHGIDNKIHTIRYYSKTGYGATSCCNHEKGTGKAFDCPYSSTCSNKGCKMTHVLDNKRLSCRQLKATDTPTKTTQEGYYEVYEALKREMNNTSPNNDIVLIKAPTGLGKTEALAQLLKNNRGIYRNTNISAPTHDLAKEHYKRIGKFNPSDPVHIVLPNISNTNIVKEMTSLQKKGLYSEALKTVERYMKTLEDIEVKEEEYGEITRYIHAVESIRDTQDLSFCTHSRMLHLSNHNIETFIIDEDIIPSLITVIEITDEVMRDIEKLIIETKTKKYTALNSSLNIVKDFISELRATPALCVEAPSFCGNFGKTITQAIKAVNPCFNLKDLLTAKFGYYDKKGKVEIVKKHELHDKKTIILSATANEEIYKMLHPDRNVRVVEVGPIKPDGDGKVVLHYNSFSREYLKNNFQRAVDIIKKEAPGVKDIITFMNYKAKFEKEGFNPIAHYGACTGIDAFAGHDIIVAGTPHINEKAYLYLAYLCGIRCPVTEDMSLQNVVDSGFEFSFCTYNSDSLSKEADKIRQIQKYKIKSELAQAVGRARILRNDCTVHLFSSYPLEGCTLYK